MKHGSLSGYSYYKCRCARCKRTWRDYHRKRRVDPEKRQESNAYHSQWQKANRGKVREYEKRYRDGHQEERRTRRKAYIEANAEKKKRWDRENYQRHKAQIIARSVIAKKLRRASHGECTQTQWEARLDFYGHRCYLCGCDWDALDPFDRTIEHVIPLSRGGTGQPANLRPACRPCNARKADKPLDLAFAA